MTAIKYLSILEEIQYKEYMTLTKTQLTKILIEKEREIEKLCGGAIII